MTMPAALTTPSMPPIAAAPRSTAAATDASSVTSAATARPRVSRATAASPSALRSSKVSAAPSAAKSRAVRRPIPDAAPVIRMRRRCRRPASAIVPPRRSGGRALVRGSVDVPDLPGGLPQLVVAQLRRHLVLFGLREKAAEAQRLLEEPQGGVERALPLGDRQRDLLGQTGPDVEVGAYAERVEAQRLLAFAGDGDHDRGPFDVVRLPAAELPVG